MSRLTVYHPSLFGDGLPFDSLSPTEWPATEYLAKLCSKADIESKNSSRIESDIFSLLRNTAELVAPDDQITSPSAYLRARAIGYSATGHLACFDLINLHMDMHSAVPAAHHELNVSDEHADQLLAELNTLYAEDNIKFIKYKPHQWLIDSLEPFEHNCPPLIESMHVDVLFGDASKPLRKFRKFISEIEMLLHSYAESTDDFATVNSVWLWGAVSNDFDMASVAKFDAIKKTYTDSPFASDIFKLVGVEDDLPGDLSVAPVISDLIDSKFGQDCFVAICRDDTKISGGDLFAWVDDLSLAENNVYQPAFESLMDGTISELTIYTRYRKLSLTKKSLRRWWKRNKSFHQIMKLHSRAP